jgi:hypothetical protein
MPTLAAWVPPKESCLFEDHEDRDSQFGDGALCKRRALWKNAGVVAAALWWMAFDCFSNPQNRLDFP